MNLSAVTPATESTSDRVEYILDRPEVAYKGGREIGTATVNVGNYAIAADTNVLNYLRQIERSEYGSLFVSADGNIVFRPRAFFFGDVTVFADDGTGIEYSSLSNQFGDELLYNRIVLQSPAGSSTKSDSASIAEYQISQLSWTDLLNSSADDLNELGDYLLDKLSTPRLRFNNLSVQLAGQPLEVLSTLLNLDMGSYCSLVKSFVVGNPLSVTQPSTISSISHTIRPDSHLISFGLEFWYEEDAFIVGDNIRGVLDNTDFTLV
jgi:hypothetical protein